MSSYMIRLLLLLRSHLQSSWWLLTGLSLYFPSLILFWLGKALALCFNLRSLTLLVPLLIVPPSASTSQTAIHHTYLCLNGICWKEFGLHRSNIVLSCLSITSSENRDIMITYAVANFLNIWNIGGHSVLTAQASQSLFYHNSSHSTPPNYLHIIGL